MDPIICFTCSQTSVKPVTILLNINYSYITNEFHERHKNVQTCSIQLASSE